MFPPLSCLALYEFKAGEVIYGFRLSRSGTNPDPRTYAPERSGNILLPLLRVIVMKQITDIKQLFIADRPLIDLRAPIEFARGAFPNTINLPLLTDNERAAVGTCYKKHGQKAAIDLGHDLVCKEVRQQRTEAWIEFIRQNPGAVLYCFRGGLRSETVQQWLKQEGYALPRVTGGYKALRHLLMETIENVARDHSLVLLGGMTGVGKTELLPLLENSIDLEGHAHHRGSAFGGLPEGQPTNIEFENRIAIEFLKKSETGIRQWVVEHESRMIGANCLPAPLYLAMQDSPLVIVEAGIEERAERIRRDYVEQMRQQYRLLFGASDGDLQFCRFLQESLAKLQRKLGDRNWRELDAIMARALRQQLDQGETGLHMEWITFLLEHYYDKFYRKGIEKRSASIIFKGEGQACVDFLRQMRPGAIDPAASGTGS